jgi:hypothetical protein
MQIAKKLSFLLLFLALAAFYGNQSAVKWKSAETEHFLAHYPVEHRDCPSKENLVFSNGEANPEMFVV